MKIFDALGEDCMRAWPACVLLAFCYNKSQEFLFFPFSEMISKVRLKSRGTSSSSNIGLHEVRFQWGGSKRIFNTT